MGCVWIWGREGGENRRPQLSEPAPVGDLGRSSEGQSPTSAGGAPTWHTASGNSGSSPPGTRGIPRLTSTPACVFGVLSRAVSGLRADGRAPGSGEQRAALRTEAEAVPRSCQSIMLALPSHDPRCSGGSELQEALTHTRSSLSPGIPGGSVSGQKG